MHRKTEKVDTYFVCRILPLRYFEASLAYRQPLLFLTLYRYDMDRLGAAISAKLCRLLMIRFAANAFLQVKKRER